MTEQLSATIYLFKTLNKKIEVKAWFCHEVQRAPPLTIFPSHTTALTVTETANKT